MALILNVYKIKRFIMITDFNQNPIEIFIIHFIG